MSKQKKFEPIIEVQDDGLVIPKIGEWGLEKYKLMGMYCDIFTKGMKNKWDDLVYIDLFSGSGYARIKNKNKIVKTSALISLSIQNKFSKYIFSEYDSEKSTALKVRIDREFNNINYVIFNGDSNLNINNIIKEIPKTSLAFCFIDPFSLNLHFNTIKVLSDNRIDFLILLALHVDANRNLGIYLDENQNKIDNFLGEQNWRNEFIEYNKTDFILFLYEKFKNKMIKLNYLRPNDPILIRSNVRNLPLYYLAFFSEHKRGYDFFEKIRKYSTDQIELF